MLTADKAWTEDNGKIGMVGIFENFTLAAFPAQIFPFSVFIRLGDVKRGRNSLVLNLIQEGTHSVINSITAQIDVPEDQEILQIHVPIPPLVIPALGKYDFHLSINGNQIGKHTLNVIPPKVIR